MSHLPYFCLNDILTAEVNDNSLVASLYFVPLNVSASKSFFFFPRRKDNLREKH